MRHFDAARAKTVGLIALRVLGGLVAVLALFVGGSLLVLRSDWGSERVRRQVVSQVNRQIRGSFEIQRLSFGGDNIAVAGVALRDPAGGVVARVDRVHVRFSPLRLLRKEVRVTEVAIDTPVVTLISDDEGSNLARATAPREKKPQKPRERAAPKNKGGGDGWVIRMDRLDLHHGDIRAIREVEAGPITRVHLQDIGVFTSVRYATGNGNLDLGLRLTGRSTREPVGPMRLDATVAARGDVTRFQAAGELLGGTLQAHGDVDRRRLEDAIVAVNLAIPERELAGHVWGPVRVDAQANPGTSPRLDAALAIPGVRFTAKDRGAQALGAVFRLVVTDLALTGRAVAALGGDEAPALGGRGELELGIEAGKRGEPPRFLADAKGAFDGLRSGSTVISRLAMAGQVRDQGVTGSVEVAGPARVDMKLDGRLDDDRKGFTLANLVIALPDARWATQGQAHIRADERESSISNFRLGSEGQTLAVDARRRGDDIAAEVKLRDLQLGQLPTALVDPALRLGGRMSFDVTAKGRTDAPEVDAHVDLQQVRYQGFSKIGAQLTAKLREETITATLGVEAPFVRADGKLAARTDALEPGSPIDVRLDVNDLDIAQALRGAQISPLGGGRVDIKLRATGSADKPELDVKMDAVDLSAKPVAKQPVEVGRARVHLRYADRSARAELDFKSAHGGTLAVDASTRVDLSYPRVTRRRIVPAKLPVTGKVVARDLGVAWVAAFNPRIESMGGKVTVDARLAGTVGDPQFIGDVRWKGGKVIATPPPAPSRR